MSNPRFLRFIPITILALIATTGCQPGGDKDHQKKASAPASSSPALHSGIFQQNMDISVRPQDDFFAYVNGHWLQSAEFPADKVRIGNVSKLRDRSDAAVKDLIISFTGDSSQMEDPDSRKVADFYRSYMDTKTRNQLGLKPVADLLARIDALASKKDLAVFLARGQTEGLDSPLAFYVAADDKDSRHYAIRIWQSGLGLPDKDYYFNKGARFKTIRAAYVKHIENLFTLAKMPEPAKAAQTVMNLETELAAAHWSRLENRDRERLYNKYEVTGLSKISPDFDWTDYLATLDVAGQNHIIINQPSYIEGFDHILAKTSLDDWKSYLRLKVLDGFAGLLSHEFVNENFEFHAKTLYGRQQLRPLWQRAVRTTNHNLGELIGKRYVARYFKPDAKARMQQLVENLRAAYHDSILTLDWMGETTKQAALAKLAKFTPKIGYPDRWHDYSSLVIDSRDLVGNVMRVDELRHQRDLQRLKETVRDWEWGMTPQTVNAYYSASHNEIVFPAAFLVPPYFDMKADDAVNYGGIGSVIGHEMGHGFDDQGSKYDGDGNLRNWWTDADRKAFKTRTAKLIAQYNAYQVFPDLAVNGALTLGENIGDLSGLAIAYQAYHKALHGQAAPVIDGFSGDQRFFIGYAQTEMSKTREKTLRNQIATDPHSPSRFRVIGVLSNLQPFYDTYDLKPGDAMYRKPEDRVSIW